MLATWKLAGREFASTVRLRALAAVWLAGVAVFTALDLAGAPPVSFWALDGRFGPYVVASSLALLAAALIAVAIASEEPEATRRRRGWQLVALLLLALSAEQLLSAHERVTGQIDAPAAVPAAPVLALAGGVALVGAWLRAPVLAAGGALLAAALCLDLVSAGAGETIVGALELIGAGAAALGTFAELQRRDSAPGTGRGLEPGRLGRALVAGTEPGAAVRVIAVVIGALTLAGIAVNVAGVPLNVFDMNDERTVPAYVSGALLFAAGGLALLLGDLDAPDGRRWWNALGVSLIVLGVDEVAALHEHLQDVTGIKGQVFLLPLVVVAGLAWLFAIRRLAKVPNAPVLLVGGAAAWAIAQVFDVFQTGPQRNHATVVPEEVFELAGSGMFILALLLGARSWLGDDRARRPTARYERSSAVPS